MLDPVIHVESLGKRYRIGERERYLALRDLIARAVTAPARLLRGGKLSADRDSSLIWALKDVSFEVSQGEVVGIIGRNGAGKTTLLKILARVTKPTKGFAEVRGRMGSLLEVGTGFHPELTGRENTFLSGAILGMSKTEIRRKFDEIVSFAEVEKFIDTPLKHYSTGMQTRLAFAVAAHLEPEILLVDEVLSVGDMQFQKKCLGKMGDVAKAGRTILFVSHQMNQIRRLCERVVWVDDGKVRRDGKTSEVLAAYEAALSSENSNSAKSSPSGIKAQFLKWSIAYPAGDQPYALSSVGPVTFKFDVEVNVPIRSGHHGIHLYNSDGQIIWGTSVENLQLEPDRYTFTFDISTLPIKPGVYYWLASLYDSGHKLALWNGVPPLLVTTQPMAHRSDEWAGLLNMPYRFSATGTNSPSLEVEVGAAKLA